MGHNQVEIEGKMRAYFSLTTYRTELILHWPFKDFSPRFLFHIGRAMDEVCRLYDCLTVAPLTIILRISELKNSTQLLIF